MSAPHDPILRAVTRVENKITRIEAKVDAHDKQLKWIVSVALLVIGAVGGPNAAQIIAGGGP
jgi:hypothetical protein